MKRLLTLIVGAAAMMLALNSCLDNDGAEARMQYFGTCDTIIYTDSVRNAPLDSLIKVALIKMGCTYTVFEEYAQVEEGEAIYAVAKCNDQAVATWKSRVNALTLRDIEKKMFEVFSDTLYNHLGIHTSSEIGLQPITIKTQLFNALNVSSPKDYMYLYSREIK